MYINDSLIGGCLTSSDKYFTHVLDDLCINMTIYKHLCIDYKQLM